MIDFIICAILSLTIYIVILFSGIRLHKVFYPVVISRSKMRYENRLFLKNILSRKMELLDKIKRLEKGYSNDVKESAFKNI